LTAHPGGRLEGQARVDRATGKVAALLIRITFGDISPRRAKGQL
jgi:hypothetical protein